MFYAPLSEEEKPDPGPGKRTLAHGDIHVGEAVGAGKYGLVFRYGPGRVAKLSCRADEARFATWLKSVVDRHPALAEFERALELPGHCFEAPYWTTVKKSYVVIREDLPDVPAQGEALTRALDVLNRSLFQKRYPSSRVLQEAAAAAGENAYFDTVRDLLHWAQSAGLPSIGDLKVDNLGLRGTQLVVRDYDFWTVPNRPRVAVPAPAQWNGPRPSRARTPRPSRSSQRVNRRTPPERLMSLPRSETWPPGASEPPPDGPRTIGWAPISDLLKVGEELDGACYILERDTLLITLFCSWHGNIVQIGGAFFGLRSASAEADALRRAANQDGAVAARFERRRRTKMHGHGVTVSAAGVSLRF